MNAAKVLVSALMAIGSIAASAATLNTGSITMGLFADGGLGSGGVGISLAGGPGDAITPGCLCEGWGAASNGVGSYTYGGSNTFASAVYTPIDASHATSVVTTSGGLQITHSYSPAAGGKLFSVAVTIKNISAAVATDVRYARTLDWDVPPGHFSDDFSTIYGGSPTGPAGKVFHTSLDPFAPPDPMVTRTTFADQSVTDKPGDLGGYFILKFGDLAVGEETTFNTFIGADFTTAALIADLASVGVEAYSYTFDNDAGVTYAWGFAGLGLPPVFETPEPGTLALVALAGLGFAASRRRKIAA